MGSLPKMEDCENYTDSKAVEYLSCVVDHLERSKVLFDPQSIRDFIFRISQSYFDYNDDTVDKIIEELNRVKVVKLLSHFLKKMLKQLNSENETLDLLLTALINFSYKSEGFSKQIYSSHIPKLLIRSCLNEDLISKLNDNKTNHFIRRCVTIIHNVARNPDNKIRSKVSEFKKVLVRYIKRNDSDGLGVVSLLTLSYIVDEKDADLLDDGMKTIKILLEKIKYASEGNDKSGGYRLCELIYGLRCISVNDNMKKRIYEEGGIPILIDIIKKNKEEEIVQCLATIENLSFDRIILQKLQDEFDIHTIVNEFESHECIKIKRHCEGITWKLNNRSEQFHKKCQEARKNSNSKDFKFDVFISYAGQNKDKISMILRSMKQHKIRAWIDEEQMIGSAIEAMALGIEHSKCFMIGISSSYKVSENCRHEAEYAFQIRKPTIPVILELKYKPDGWLGFILGTKVYYEFSERRNRDVVMSELLKSIDYHLEIDNAENVEVVETKDETNRKRKLIPKSNEISQQWTNENVLEWLDKSHMAHVKNHFSCVDGSMLSMMFDNLTRSPDYFNNSLKIQFQMGFFDVMKFNSALYNLFSPSV